MKIFKKIILFLTLLLSLQGAAQTHSHDRSVMLSATVTSNSITLNWPTHTNVTGYTVYRKLKGGTTWGNSVATLGSSVNQYVDNSVSQNTSYEYKVVRTTANLGTGYGYINSGINMDPVEYLMRMELQNII